MPFQFNWPQEFNRLQEEMDRVFGRRNDGPTTRSRVFPAVNMMEDHDNLYIESEIPGMELDQFELLVNEDNQLTLQGDRKKPADDGGTWHRDERTFGRFSRMISLPMPVDGDACSADYTAGVLRITLPKKPEAKPRRITVSAS
ncbi:MAG: Hsp20/alpha crystallin family protein [Planctomycetales bacterium]|nr:Hsp20/alpha crystallin family protein [Planctomycetales bacterium]